MPDRGGSWFLASVVILVEGIQCRSPGQELHLSTPDWIVYLHLKQSDRPPLKVSELQAHPAFKKVIWNLKPTSHGRLPVAKNRGGPINIDWEVHGNGPNHVVLIMGLGGLKSAWQRQTKDLGHDRSDKYSVLVFDNRGIGKSDKPWVRYSTSEMAKDVIEICDHIGWTGKRELHVCGVSMGGMISQELAYLIPERVASLLLVSTAARLVNTIGFYENLRNRINLFIPKDMDRQIAEVKWRIFGPEWLVEPDTDGEFPTNGDRFAAQEIHKRLDTEAFTRKGFTLQAIAAGWHHKSPQQLAKIADSVGRDRILVMHGMLDNMISVPHADVLLRELNGSGKGVTSVIYEKSGHGLMMEQRQDLLHHIETMVEKSKQLK